MASSYEVFDVKEQRVVRVSKSRSGAQRTADRRNLEYGAHRYNVRPIW